MAIECRCCKVDTFKRIVITRKPLKELPDKYRGYREFCCNNTIKTKRIWTRKKDESGKRNKNTYKWLEEVCRNHMLVK